MNNKRRLLLLTAIFISSCTGTTAASKKTVASGLMDGKEYPPAKYLTAEGIGQSESEARDRAKAELSNIFESKVSSEVINRVRSVIDKADKETVTRDDEQKIRVLSSVDLKGMEIGKVWHDRKQGNYHALAVLSRHKAREEWQGKVEDIDDRIEAMLSSFESQKSNFSRLQTLKKARRLWLEREVVVSRLRVLGFSDASTADYDIKSILDLTAGISASLVVKISITGGAYGGLISDEITEALNGEGYVVTGNGDDANIEISGLVKVLPVELNNPGWEFARAAVSIALNDAETGLTVGEISENKRASHLTYEEAAHKAVKGVSALVVEKVLLYFNDDEDE